GEGVKLPACGIRAIGFRHVAIEAARVRVLGFVKEAGARIRRGRLVREASGVVNRSAVTDAEARHLEYVTVVEAVGSIVERVERFFAADPAAPWRQTSGAVTDRAREAAPRRFELADVKVEHEIRRAAGLVRVVFPAGAHAARTGAAAELVVTDHHDAMVLP